MLDGVRRIAVDLVRLVDFDYWYGGVYCDCDCGAFAANL